MSQWKNRYDVLSSEECNFVDSDKSDQSEIMSIPSLIHTSGSSPSSKIHIRTAQLKIQTEVQLQVKTLDTGVQISLSALLDSGATGLFLDTKFVKEQNLNTRKLPKPIPVYNVDGTLNQGGSIQEELDLIVRFQNHTEKATFAVCDLGNKAAIIGHTWLFYHNPEIDWKTGEITFSRCPSDCHVHVQKVNKRVKEKRRRANKTGKLPVMPVEEEDEEQQDIDDNLDLDLDNDRVFVAFIRPETELAQINATTTHSTQMAADTHKHDTKKSFEELVPSHYHQFKSVFSKEEFDQLPDRKPWDHAIELKFGSEPWRSKVYPLSPNEQDQLDAFLEENLKSGRIQPSKSPMASPVFFVKKKDGSLRLVQDYRKLNDMTIKNSYPLPLVSDIISKLRKAKYFTKLDVRWGYNNVRIKKNDEWKAAFRTNRGLFEPLVMFFGLTNSPATFQTMMNDLFKELIDEGVTIVYIDDILIYTEDLAKHREVVKRVLEILEKHHLYLKPEKCEFEKEKVEYLGLIISHGKIEMDPVKVEGVSKWPVPTSVKEIQSFLGFVNFYRRFI
jgi:hypothetical protein